MTGDGVPPIDDWNRLLEGRVAVITGGSIRSHVADVTVDDDVARLAEAVLTCLAVDLGRHGWLFSPREGRFVNRSKNL